jgi:diguanylate cyclase (GGDEF)-like protein
MQQGAEKSIGRAVFVYAVIVAAVMVCGAGALLLHKQSRGVAADLAAFEQRLISQQKIRLKHDVEALISWIDRQRTGTEELHRSYVDIAINELGREAPGAGYANEQAQRILLEALAEDPGVHEQNYFFIYQLHNLAGGKDFATMLFNPQRPDLAGKKLSDDETDAAGNYYRKAFMKDIRSSGESFLIYSYRSQDESKDSRIGRRLSYFRLYPEWNWVIAKGVDLDEIDQLIAGMAATGKIGLRRDLLLLSILFIGGILLALAFSKAAGARIDRTLAAYRQSEEQNRQTIISLNKRLEQQSRADTLTAAYNRSYLEQELAKETMRSNRYQTPLSMIMFTIDSFRAINEELGTQAGDRALQELVDLVSDNIRRTDILARFGSAEFVILAPGIDLEQAMIFAEKLHLLVAQKTFLNSRQLTCSFGVSFYFGSEEPSALVRRAESALAQAKRQGANCCVAQQD